MIYLDHSATSFRKPASVVQAMHRAMLRCANPGRGGYPAAMAADRTVFHCRQTAAALFDCQPEQVAFTANCTQGLNTAIHTLVKPGADVLITGFEHNAVTRPLYGMGARMHIAGRKLFDWQDTLEQWETALNGKIDVAVFTCVSNVFGYILPVKEMARLCREKGVPFIVDAAQGAGTMPLSLNALGADFIAMPGHKGLLGPQGTGMLLCATTAEPLMMGGTGSNSIRQQMPEELPDRLEAGTLNVPGIAGLDAGMAYVQRMGPEHLQRREAAQARRCAKGLKELGLRVFSGEHQAGIVSFVPHGDCQEMAAALAKQGIAVRAGLHCAPLAHESAKTLETGTVRISYGPDATAEQTATVLEAVKKFTD